ncbi:MAG TPA: type II toxin-antitoxin system PrlF family antitoxin [Candidatus Binataceae bacterium]|nr:type II toxin-antitoxin system PrlF family antitoxin [Candidatus Binataceae bacterium]
MATATVTSKGQTTIPKRIREHLRLGSGDRVEFVIDREGRVVLTPLKVDIRELRGMLGRAPRHVTIEEMDEAIKEAVVRKYRSK